MSDTEIPPELLQRLVQEFVEDKDTRISQPALEVLGKYFETFIREAVWRAAAIRKETDKPDVEGSKRVVGGGTVFLEVEDLEKVAPQLLLDF
ncbi:centromere protein X [Trichophaea hybrida]|nr:centromere protein X [Trichophaea hybrida]